MPSQVGRWDISRGCPTGDELALSQSMEFDWQHLRDEIERRMVERGYSQSSLARAIGVHATYVRDILKGRSKSPGYDKIVAIADKLGCTVEELTGSAAMAPANPPMRRKNPPISETLPEAIPSGYGMRDLKVLGVAAGSPEGWFNLDEANVVEVAFRPPELAGVRDAFGIYVAGDSMTDFGLSAGTLLHIHPHRRPHPGQFVVLVKTNDEAFVKRYVGRRNGAIKLVQSNPSREFEIAEIDVKALYAVVGATFT
jgi:phage repressor protein C with HTH and peptisase S24 domain